MICYFFFKSMHEAVRLLDELVRSCASIGLVLSPSRIKILTNEAQAPNNVFTSAGLQVNALPHAHSHKWLCCFLSARGSPDTTAAVELHLNAFYANRAAFCNQNASIAAKLQSVFFRIFTSARPVLSVCVRVCDARTTCGLVLQFFNAIVTPQMCALQLDTALCTAQSKIDVRCRKLAQQLVGASDYLAFWPDSLARHLDPGPAQAFLPDGQGDLCGGMPASGRQTRPCVGCTMVCPVGSKAPNVVPQAAAAS